jgi:hypothetical protein
VVHRMQVEVDSGAVTGLLTKEELKMQPTPIAWTSKMTVHVMA